MDDMRSFLKALIKMHPEDVLEIKEEVSLEYEITAIQMELIRSGIDPVINFKNISNI